MIGLSRLTAIYLATKSVGYVPIQAHDGNWGCVLTYGPGHSVHPDMPLVTIHARFTSRLEAIYEAVRLVSICRDYWTLERSA
jgi:hypothetical protein